MSRWIDADEFIKIFMRSGCYGAEVINRVTQSLLDAPSIDIVPCRECRRIREDGGHANCGGYLYCRKWKTLVDEDSYCSWGEREGE